MNKLANNGLGNDNNYNNYMEIILGYEDDELREELCEGLKEYFEEKGLEICIVEQHKSHHRKNYNVIVHVIEWIGNLVHFSLFNHEGKTYDLDVSINYLTTAGVMELFKEYVEGLRLA